MNKGTMPPIFEQTRRRLAEWQADPAVLGVLVVGSKSHGNADRLSDDDLEVLLTEEAHARRSPRECVEFLVEGAGPDARIIYDAQYTTLADMGRKAGSPHDLDRWPYERALVLFDRDGQVERAVRAAGQLDPDFRRTRLRHATIDAGIAARRAQKTFRREMPAAGRLLVARGAKALARVLFALESRWVPLDHWLEPELKTLADPARCGPLLVQALLEASPDPIMEALNRLEDRLWDEGVPRPAARRELFFELVHPSKAEERAIHGLY